MCVWVCKGGGRELINYTKCTVKIRHLKNKLQHDGFGETTDGDAHV